jgi:predicted nucleotidyltransferase
VTVEGQWDFRPERRSALARRVIAALRADPRVASVGLCGSLASGEEDGYPADRYSDIDVEVRLRGVSDRDFFLAVPALVGDVGAILMRGASVEPDRHVAHLWFAGYPLFWHVDIACLSPEHGEGDDLVEATRVERALGLWLLAVKRLLRAMDAIALVREAVDGSPDGRRAHGAPADQLVALLEMWRRRAAAEGKPYDQTYAACVEVARRLLR